jgi:trans-aconitate 2-methyltransferase
MTWDPRQYGRFASERSRPFSELVDQVDLPGARSVVDLGCGDGSTTATLRDRWPSAHIVGIDNSPEMIAAAEPRAVPGELEFRLGSIADWEPRQPVDVLISNAALHWVPGHLELLGRLTAHLRPGGVLAFQVPGNFGEPSHRLIEQLCAEPPFAEALAGTERERAVSHDPAVYLEKLLDLGMSARTWEVTYCQLLGGDHAVLEWLKGTALRPVLALLDAGGQQEFLDELGRRLDAAYPPGPHGTVLPFRRIFAVARQGGEAGAEAGAGAPHAIAGLDHVQVAAPEACEEAARGFYAGVLGLAERSKPAVLAARGGCWFRGHGVELHVGVQADFRPAAKAHVALAVEGLDGLAAHLEASGHRVTWDGELAPLRRFYTDDPFGNRLELLERQAD